ncbi:myo-inosose-2 dehydratase [Pseudanabaena sp. 'Roaring Creek']|uniref:myo-inosose-2 dehydratase n=1 Tax=Pseudanabaena sp. 'Roaring Creek' TaxID=1681830 RepID=UPI000A65ADA7|nr:myo-inosose-2 dehydratase [Pseudanabaena sp. 'Roaring Creek']
MMIQDEPFLAPIVRKIRLLGTLLVLATVFVLVGMTFSPLQVNAATMQEQPSIAQVSVKPTNKPTVRIPKFDSKKVFLGITPTGWSNSDDPSIDLVPPIPYRQIFSEMALAGFKGSQMSGKYPQDLTELKKELGLRGLTISEPWVGTYFTIGDKTDSQKIFDQQLAFMKSIGGDTIVVAELGGAVHQQPIAPLPNRPIFNDTQWKALTDGLNDLGKQAHDAGMKLVYHPHVGTGVETMADIDRLMTGTNPQYLSLLLDTGHLYYAGVNPLEVTQKYADRIKHVHLKNIRKPIYEQSKTDGLSFLNSIRAGVFTVPGDKEGDIDFKPILDRLALAKYEGWLIVEAEQDPNKANPLQYALMARTYLKQVTGL